MKLIQKHVIIVCLLGNRILALHFMQFDISLCDTSNFSIHHRVLQLEIHVIADYVFDVTTGVFFF